MTATRRLAAILAADVAGYSRLMGADEEGTHERLKAHRRELIDLKIREHSGRMVKTTGDGMLAEFPSVVDAVRCAVEMQRAMADREPDVSEERRIRFRIGVNLGDIIVDGDDIFGDGVNVAARLEGLAEPGGICISRVVRDQIRDKLFYPFEDMGEQTVKNIARPVRAYALDPAAVAASPLAAVTVNDTALLSSPKAPPLSIVVLPFANLSNDPDREYFADGITEDLTIDLSRIADMFVISRNTAFTYKGRPNDARQVSRELGVRYVLEGSVRRTGDRVRVNVQLIDGENGAQLWADRFDTNRADLDQAQDEITGRLAQTLNRELVVAAVSQIERRHKIDPDARDLVMQGWAWYYRPASSETRQRAQRFFERALEIDPSSIDARIGIASVLVSMMSNLWSSSIGQYQARAEQLLLEALEGSPNSSIAHYAMGFLRREQNRLAESRIELEKAISLDRNNANGLHQLGSTLRFLGEPALGLPYAERAIRLNPHDPNIAFYYFGLGMCHLVCGHLDEAVEYLRKACASNPRFWLHHFHLAAALGLSGEIDEARVALAHSLSLKPELNSLARYRAEVPFGNARYWTLREKTVDIGLRRAGLPDE